MMKQLLLPLLFFLVVCFGAQAQGLYTLSGQVNSSQDSTAIPGATLVLKSLHYDALVQAVNADDTGNFHFTSIQAGSYHLITSYLGYLTDTTDVVITNANITLLISLKPKEMKDVVIEELLPRMEIKGDTLQYNANAFKVNKDATAEDLFKKMPGVTTDGGTVKVNGEEVKKILVDGKPFFTDDPSATLRNMPADMVENIQVFDKQSDQAEFGGYKDGNAEKTLNVRTKPDRKQGTFGKLYAGAGTTDKYNTGGSFNLFRGNRRVSVLGMTNNINEQNFSFADIMSATQNNGQRGPGSGANLMNAVQSGISTTSSAGVNYGDSWGKRTTVSGSYFFNTSKNNNESNTIRDYYTLDQQRYEQNSTTTSTNTNHRGNLKIEFSPDSMNKLIVSTRITSQETGSLSGLFGLTSIPSQDLSTIRTTNNNSSNQRAYNLNNDTQWQHRFLKKGRTISLNINSALNKRSGSGNYISESLYFLQNDSLASINQRYTNGTTSISFTPSLSYTEPLTKKSMLQGSLRPSYLETRSEKLTYDVSASDNIANTILSNRYTFRNTKQAGGLYYKYTTDSLEISAGADAELSALKGNQEYPMTGSTDRSFFNLLPRVSIVKRYAGKSNLNINLSSYTSAPSITQLQNVADVSNPLFVKSGNANLSQSRSNSLEVRYMKRMPEKEKHFIVGANATQTSNYIGSSTTILRSDTTIQGVAIARGAQWSEPVNLNNYFSSRVSASGGFPLKKMKSNLNLNTNYSFTQTPAIINEILNLSRNHNITAGFSTSSNISEKIDFNFSYNATFNNIVNSKNTANNNQYWQHLVTGKVNITLLERLVLNTDLSYTQYIGLAQSNVQQYFLWNGYVGYKLGKAKAIELKVSCFDILNQNTSLSRTVRETYAEDNRTTVLRRFGMVTLTYTFKKFAKGSEPKEDEEWRKMRKMMPPPGGMPPPPGMGPGGN